MLQFKYLFAATCIIHFTSSAVINLNKTEISTELVLVNVVFRHGQRTTYKFYPNDPNKNVDFHPIGMGGLTNEGKMGEFQLGQFLRKMYHKFLGSTYTEEIIETRSTDVHRTKMSAQLCLAGLWPPTKQQQWHADIPWQPIPVFFKKSEEEDLLNPTNCQYRKQVLENLSNVEAVQDIYIKPYSKLFNFIENNSGMKIKNVHDLIEFYFILNTEADLNMTMPEWTKEIYPEPLYSTASLVYSYLNFNEDIQRINVGYLIRKILNDCQNKVNGKEEYQGRKMFLYSGHESTLGYLLHGVKTFKPHIPAYGSAVMIELHKDKSDNYYIKLLYRNNPSESEPKLLTIPNCEALCPLDKFISLQRAILPTVSIQDACKLPR